MGLRERLAKLEKVVYRDQIEAARDKRQNDERARLRALALESEANLYTLEAKPGATPAPAAQSAPTLFAPKPPKP